MRVLWLIHAVSCLFPLRVTVRSIRSLPDFIAPLAVIESRLEHMDFNRNFTTNGDYQRVFPLRKARVLLSAVLVLTFPFLALLGCG